ncbi:MAG: MFS transporter [Gammaproteobacteria bacterium]|nr:MFS transporter [Gammaproteobacteria bacterium]
MISGVEVHNRNALYLLAALCMIFMTMILAIQPVYLRVILGVTLADAGAINANVQVVTEVLDMLVVGYLGYLSDRYGRVTVIVYGFLVAAVAALIIPSSHQIGLWLGVGGLTVFYLMRIFMSLGTAAVWPQLAALTGDFSTRKERASLMANTAFMMAFGATLVYAVLMQLPKYLGIEAVMYLIAIVAFAGAWFARRSLVDVAQRFDEERVPWRQIGQLLRHDRRMRLAFLSAFASRNDMVLIGLFMMLWMIYFADIVGMTQEEAVARGGLVIGLIGAIILVTIPIWGWFIQRYGRIAALTVGMAFSGIGFTSMWFVVNPYDWGIYIPAILIAIGQAGTLLAPQIITIDLAPPSMRGIILGAFNTVGGIGMIVFVQIGGFLFDLIGPYGPFIFTGIGNLFIMLYAIWLLKVLKEPEPPEIDEACSTC